MLDFHYGYDLHRERIAKLEKEAELYRALRAARAERSRPHVSFSLPRLHRRPRLVARTVR